MEKEREWEMGEYELTKRKEPIYDLRIHRILIYISIVFWGGNMYGQ